jgi:hypothetical protein
MKPFFCLSFALRKAIEFSKDISDYKKTKTTKCAPTCTSSNAPQMTCLHTFVCTSMHAHASAATKLLRWMKVWLAQQS